MKIIQNYLLNQKPRTKVESSYSTRENIISGVLQGSILGAPLFNIFLCDLFLEQEYCCFFKYADDTTPYVTAKNPAEAIENLTSITNKLFTWSANPDKCHLLLSTPIEANIQIASMTVKYSRSKKSIENNLTNILRIFIRNRAEN